MRFRPTATALAALCLIACSRESKQASPAAESPSGTLVAARPYEMHAPPKHDGRAPLLVFLHGFGGDHAELAAHFGVGALADAHGFYVALPDGTVDGAGKRFWNATDGCCDFEGIPVDDVAYIDAIIDDAIARYAVDPARVYVAGYSNGGFMAHRYACDRAERVAAVASFAGAPWKDASLCKSRVPVSVLQVQGDRDEVVRYEGTPARRTRSNLPQGAVPGTKEGIAMWARLDACGDPATKDEGRDETLAYGGCAAGTEVRLWTVHGAGHGLRLTRDDMDRVWEFLSAHVRR